MGSGAFPGSYCGRGIEDLRLCAVARRPLDLYVACAFDTDETHCSRSVRGQRADSEIGVYDRFEANPRQPAGRYVDLLLLALFDPQKAVCSYRPDPDVRWTAVVDRWQALVASELFFFGATFSGDELQREPGEG